MKKRWISFLLVLCMVLTLAPVLAPQANAATSLPSSIYLKQQENDTCTLASAAMMLRARMYLCGNSDWSKITESGIRSVAWKEGSGLYYSWSYTINGNSMTVDHTNVYGISISSLKSLLDKHPEGIELYVGSIPHAVLVTDYEGDTFYCADPGQYSANGRVTLASSYLGTKKGNQAAVLNAVTDYWYISNYSINGGTPGKPVLKGLRDKYPDGKEITLTCDSVTNANQYMFNAEKLVDGNWEVIFWRARGDSRECTLTVSTGSYRARAFAYNTNALMPDGRDYLRVDSDYAYFTVAGEHTCDNAKYVYYWAVHPHCNCYECSICGEVNADRSSSNFVDSCNECHRPAKPAFVNLKKTYVEGEETVFTWTETANTTHNNFWLWYQDEEGTWVDDYGHWTTYEHTFYAENGKRFTLPVGKYRVLVSSNNNKYMEEDNSDYLHIDSDFVYFEVVKGASITTQPKNASAKDSAYAAFTVKATGSGLKYQWQFLKPNGSWTNCTSATQGYNTATLKVQGVTGGTNRDGYQYRCVVTDSAGNKATSKAATLRVLAIKTQPTAATVSGADYATFKVAATGSGLKYQWQYLKPSGSWTNCTSKTQGYNTATLKVQGKSSDVNRNGYQYRCVVTDASGNTVTSSAAKLTVNVLKITTQPKAASVKTSAYATFKVVASGSGLKYQWQYLKPNGSWTNCTSATQGYNTATLKVQGVTGSTNRNNYQYRCIVTDSSGAKVTSSAVKLSVLAITSQPQSAVVAASAYATFTVKATGSSLQYQWQFKTPSGDWKNCTSATQGYNTATLKVQGKSNGVNRSGYQYRCIVTSGSQKLTSSAVTLTVK